MLGRLIDAFSQLQGRRTYHTIGNVSTNRSPAAVTDQQQTDSASRLRVGAGPTGLHCRTARTHFRQSS